MGGGRTKQSINYKVKSQKSKLQFKSQKWSFEFGIWNLELKIK